MDESIVHGKTTFEEEGCQTLIGVLLLESLDNSIIGLKDSHLILLTLNEIVFLEHLLPRDSTFTGHRNGHLPLDF